MKDYEEKYDVIMERLKVIEELQRKSQIQIDCPIMDNQEFTQLMNISKRHAQKWRDTGCIGFIQIGNKYYYKIADIVAMIDKHYKPAN